ncbi:MAG: acyl-CoA dehydrogenase family protein [Deltaproteobacteria bacterium]|nr:acyl-CoA dehydrogenase family protein [Candidatus Deferrimicrobiaceae bacterium]
MRFELTDEQQQVLEMVQSLARKSLAPKAAGIDEESRFPEENLRQLAGLGLLGMLYPASFGGSEAGAVAYNIALREVAGGCASTAVGMAVTNMVGEAIWRFGTDEQRKKYLPGLATYGIGLGAFALTEPSAGSDAGGLATTAVEDAGEYVLNGSKMFITNGAHAGVTIVMAVTQKDPKRISAFLVEPGTPGFSVGKPERKMGLKGSDTVSMSFDDCRIPKRNLLGSLGEGLKIALATLDGGRIGISSQAIGIAGAAVDAAAAYAQDRRQFGQPISAFQAIRWMLADAATGLEAAQLLAYRAAWLKEKGKPYTREASMAKVFASEAGNRACQNAVQVLGGYGYIREYPVERHLRDIKVTTIYEGTSEIQRIVVSRSLLR